MAIRIAYREAYPKLTKEERRNVSKIFSKYSEVKSIIKQDVTKEKMMEKEKHIDDIIKLSKRNPVIKQYLLKKIMDNFFGDLEKEYLEWFSSNDMLR